MPSDSFTAQILCDPVCELCEHPGEGHRGTQELILSLKKSLEAEQLRSMTLAQVGDRIAIVVIKSSNTARI